MARQDETLLDILIRAFADQLTNEVRRGLPRQYLRCEEDLPTLRGRLDVTRQFTTLAVRPDRLACQFDILSPNTALLQLMKACVVKPVTSISSPRRTSYSRWMRSVGRSFSRVMIDCATSG